MFTLARCAIDKYIDDLPPKVRDNLLSSKPDTVEEAIQLVASLSDNLVKVGELTRGKMKRTKDVVDGESGKEKVVEKKKKINLVRSYAVVEPLPPQPKVITQQPYQPQTNQTDTRKVYNGPHPLFSHCKFHHPSANHCLLCTKGNRLGHFALHYRIQNSIPAPAPAYA